MLKGLRVIPVLMPLITSVALAQQHPSLHTHMAAPTGAHLMGRMQKTQRMQVAMTLQLRNETQLDALLQRRIHSIPDTSHPNRRTNPAARTAMAIHCHGKPIPPMVASASGKVVVECQGCISGSTRHTTRARWV